ncbi:MAG: phosphoribosylanthranilate isomerase [Nitrospira sp.]|nr:phosphoribosylanthranilate isomerase [Nitrospira sp.]
MVKVKICGITNLDDAMAAAEAGADALGFVFYPESPRYIEPGKARDIISKLPVFVSTVGVFVDENHDMIRRILRESGIQILQFHGEESPFLCTRFREKVIKAIVIKDSESINSMMMYSVDSFLLDTHDKDKKGGTGKTFNWEFANMAKEHGRVILSGGLQPANVREAIEMVHPYGVDVSSGVEITPGKKDHDKVAEFIREVRKINAT